MSLQHQSIYKLLGLGLISLGFLAAGCSGEQQLKHDLDDYQQRLAAVLKTPRVELHNIDLPAYPERQALENVVPSLNIPLSEFYQLQNCQLATLVAERNTSLGRTHYPSTRYLYEVKLLQALQDCTKITEKSELRTQLNIWQEQKQTNLMLVWANLLQISEETTRAFSGYGGYIQGNDKDGISQTANALSYLYELKTVASSDASTLEQHLNLLQRYQLPSKLWRSLLLLSKNLNALTLWLDQNQSSMHCPNNKASQQVDYLSNVFQLLFIEKIQPLAGQINHYYYQLLPILNALRTDLHLSPSFTQRIGQLQIDFSAYQQAMNEHIQFWQGLFKRCSISPMLKTPAS